MKTKFRFVFSVNSAALLHANGEEGRGHLFLSVLEKQVKL